MPDRMPEDMSDRMPEDLPARKCINVMVGITRSKVIFLAVTGYFMCGQKLDCIHILQNDHQTHELIDIQVPTIGLP